MADAKGQQQGADAAVGSVSELDGLLAKEFRPKTPEANEAVTRAVRTLAELPFTYERW